MSLAIKIRFENKKIEAAKRGYTFSLTLENFELFAKATKCEYTNLPFTKTNFMTLERIDNTIGYEPGNVIPVCFYANNIKGAKDIKQIINKIIQNSKEEPYLVRDYVKSILALKELSNKIKNSPLDEIKALSAEFKQINDSVKIKKTKLDILRADIKVLKMIKRTIRYRKHVGWKYMTQQQRMLRVIEFVEKNKVKNTPVFFKIDISVRDKFSNTVVMNIV